LGEKRKQKLVVLIETEMADLLIALPE